VSFEVTFRPEAEADLEDAAVWYESQRTGLGHSFLDEVESLTRTLAEQPLAFPLLYRNTRRALLRRFPFALFYRVMEQRVLVLAVLHGSRHPRLWKSRT
jgi:plasmid stabilization system protein ParE